MIDKPKNNNCIAVHKLRVRHMLPDWMRFSRSVFILLFCTLINFSNGLEGAVISDENPLSIPAIGDHGLRLISPTVLEVTLINTKTNHSSPVTAWDFVANQVASLPAVGRLAVTVDGVPASVQSIGFKRRPLYAPETPGDLRIANHLYLKLVSPVKDGSKVEVKNAAGDLWASTKEFITVADPGRLSPAIHVNQVGYMPNYPKKAAIGFYLGSMGELEVPTAGGFQLIRRGDGAVVYSGTLRKRLDQGFNTTPLPYQRVWEADFSAYTAEGEYRLYVSGLGVSFPFRIDEGITANFARTFALGLYNQRCGGANVLPHTRHTHAECHVAPAEVPTMDPAFAKTQDFISEVTADAKTDPDVGARHIAPRMTNVASSLYPFVRQGKIDVRGGHHDAGDYSKYTINSANLVHFLVFAADSFAGVGALDNLGLPESGDGKSDILQEAKWEADFLAKLQDSDGGFYFLVYPKNQRYENRVLPQNGLPQVVWPKNTAVTAAAVGALAEAGSSPLMKAQFPTEAALYLQKAKLGWQFLMNAMGDYGKEGSYQQVTHYGKEFIHDDELAWAAAAMYAATGENQYHQRLFQYLPNPNAESTRRWTWWKLFEGYGNAIRTYAFAVRSGRLKGIHIDLDYLEKCEAEILGAAEDHLRFSQQSAYGTSLPEGNKARQNAGWYFSSERAFDITVAYQLRQSPSYIEAVVANFNYEAGSNPLNMTYITGIGSKRQRDIVNQYAWNDHRILPPSGIPLGNVQQNGYGYLEVYTKPVVFNVGGQLRTNWANSLPDLSFPSDFGNNSYGMYDRWTDMINTTAEFVVMDQARSLASLAFWMAQGPAKSQSWRGIQGTIQGLEPDIQAGAPATLSIHAPGIDLSEAHVVWEIRYQDPIAGNPVNFKPKFSGDHWVEAEALLPDGRRIVAIGNFTAMTSVETLPNAWQSEPVAPSSDVAALYHVDTSGADAAGRQSPLTLSGNTRIDRSNLGWMKNRSGAALRFLDLGDSAKVQLPVSSLITKPDTSAIVLEAMIYVNEFKAFDRGVATILSLEENDWSAYMKLIEDKYEGPMVKGGPAFSYSKPELAAALTPKYWHHLRLALNKSGYSVSVDGEVLTTRSSLDLDYWGRAQTATLSLGNFDGWIDEIVVRNVGGLAANPTLTVLGVSANGFRMRVTGQAGNAYRVQSSSDNKEWHDVSSVTLGAATGEITIPLSGSLSFFRVVKS